MGKIDLHLHSSVSDGLLSPQELADKAVSLGLTAISLTDHDNVDGNPQVSEAISPYPDMTFIPGIEISTNTRRGEVHILGYYIDSTDSTLLETLESMRNARVRRAKKMLERLAHNGAVLEWERVREIAGDGTVGRPHVAQALLEKGYVSNTGEAFRKFLAFGGPAYVPRAKMEPKEAIGLIVKAKGIPVLAHPLTYEAEDPETLIGELAAIGLAGVEVYYKAYSEEDRETLARLAEKYGLIATGGSDFHGFENNNEIMMGEANVPQEVVDRLQALAAQRPL